MKRILFFVLLVVGLFVVTVKLTPPRKNVRVTYPPIEKVLEAPPAPTAPVPSATPPVIQSVVPTFEFERPCEPAYHRLMREQIVKELQELLSKMSNEEQEQFLTALYDAQENLATIGVPTTDVYFMFTQELRLIFGERYLEIVKAHVFATMLGVVETRALRTGREFITDEAWFHSHGVSYRCQQARK